MVVVVVLRAGVERLRCRCQLQSTLGMKIQLKLGRPVSSQVSIIYVLLEWDSMTVGYSGFYLLVMLALTTAFDSARLAAVPTAYNTEGRESGLQ